MLKKSALIAFLSMLLTACGGGGGSGGSPVVSAPPPPVATAPRDVSKLTTNQTFEVRSATETARYDLDTGQTLLSESKDGGIVINYNAGSDSYTVTASDGRTASFAPANEVGMDDQRDRIFRTSSGSTSNYLTLAYAGYGSNLVTKSVALGFWQSNVVTGNIQDTNFDIFVYGFPASDAAIPVSGSADFKTDVFGFSSQVGLEPVSFRGSGTTVFDFLRGTFAMETTVDEYYLATGAQRFGALYLRAAGDLSSSANAFDGTFIYDGSLNTIFGSLSGAFYGQTASEAGGIFSGDDGEGNSVVGGFTALRSGEATRNLSLYDLKYDQTFYTGTTTFVRRDYKDGSDGFVSGQESSNGQLHYRAADKSFQVAGYTAQYGGFAAAEIVSDAGAEFEVYRKTLDNREIQLSLYQPANGGEIELTYSGFGIYSNVYEDAAQTNVEEMWLIYGQDTPDGVLGGRTGSATYNGIARGTAGSSDGKRELSVTGTSQFLIDFATQGYSGWLRLAGRDKADGTQVDFGQIDLEPGTGIARNAFTTNLNSDGSFVGSIQSRFYGPTGQELASVFRVLLDGYGIAGASVAKAD